MSFTAHLRCANQGVVRILLLPGAINATEKNMMTFMAWQGQRSNPGGVPGPDQARPTQCALFNLKVKGQTLGESRGQTEHDRHSVPYLAQRSKVKKCTRTCPALTTCMRSVDADSLDQISCPTSTASAAIAVCIPVLFCLRLHLDGPVCGYLEEEKAYMRMYMCNG